MQSLNTRSLIPSLLSVIFVFVATMPLIAQEKDKEKIDKANVILYEGLTIASQNTPESWTLAEAKLNESYALFIVAVPPESKNEIIEVFAEVVSVKGNAYIALKQFKTAENLLNFVLGKVRDAGLRGEVGKQIEYLGNSAVIQDQDDLAAERYKQALAIHIEFKNYDHAGFCSRQLGLMAYEVDKIDDAIKHFSSAIQHYRSAKNRTMLMRILTDQGDAYAAKKAYKDCAPFYKEALELSIELKDKDIETVANVGLALVAYFDYRGDEAMKHFLAVLPYFEADTAADHEEKLAWHLMRIGKTCVIVWDLENSEKYLRRSAAIFEKVKNRIGQADALMNLGNVELMQSNNIVARSHVEKAVELFKAENNEQGIAMAYMALADCYMFETKFEKALELAIRGKELAEKVKDDFALNAAFRTMGWSYACLNRFDEAIKVLNVALKNARETGDSRREADTLINIGLTYSSLGLTTLAIEYYEKALTLSLATDNKVTEAVCLNNIGYNNFVLGDLKKGREYLERAVTLMRPLKMNREEGYALHNLGMIFSELKDYKSARSNYQRALKKYLATKDRRVEAYAYWSLGQVDALEAKWNSAVEYFEKAILLARETSYSGVEGNALTSMMDLWEIRKQPRLAILYGKQAVNLFQSIRSENKGLQKSELAAYMQQNEIAYRNLADVLVSVGRLPEAQQVLDLLKGEEYMEFVRRDASEAADQSKLALTDAERKALDEYTRLSGQLTALGTRFQSLQDARSRTDGKLPELEEAEFQKLKTQIEEAGVGIRTFLSKLVSEFSRTVEDQATITPNSIETLRADLRRVGPDVVLVSTYLLPGRYRAIVTTGRTMVDRKVEYSDRKLTQTDINNKVSEFRLALQNTSVDPRPLGKELYDIFVKPLEADIKGSGAKTILWSLDGTLRYIPIAALSPDGKTYMAEHYQNVVVTLARQTNLFTKPSGDEWRALGAGVSKKHEGFSPLPAVVAELNAIVKDGGTSGVMNGRKLVDEKFNLEAFRNAVPQQTEDGKVFNVVHLATHFTLGMNDRDSALLLGDGKRLSLFDISKDESLDFKDVELLALSACETGVAVGDSSGREVESLGMLAEKKGAKAVLATLWKVADEGTSAFMTEFYRNKLADPRMNKSEAIRLTQVAMINGRIKSKGTGGGCRAELNPGTGQKPFKCDPNAPFSHPSYWSPFVLIGNWR